MNQPTSHQPMIESAAAAIAAGRIGLPWNIQADYLIAGAEADADQLLLHARSPLVVVLDLLGQPVHRVYARFTRAWQRGADDLVLLFLDHDHAITSTVMAGSAARMHGIDDGAPAVHRYRISGSHGVLDLDLLRDGVTVRTADHLRQRPISGTDAEDSPSRTDDQLAPILQAARSSAAAGHPMEVAR